MAQAYFDQGMFAPATFSLSVRSYPANRGSLVSAGLDDVLEYLALLNFGDRAVDYLRSTGIFGGDFLEYLRGVRFTGDVRAIPEGRLFFVDEPVLEVSAPIIEAQLVETYVINQVTCSRPWRPKRPAVFGPPKAAASPTLLPAGPKALTRR